MFSMDVILFLLKVAITYGLCYIIYKIFVKFKELVKTHELYMRGYDLLNSAMTNTPSEQKLKQFDDDDMYDKSDEELLKEWDDLWDGNPPCELDLDTIREEERREKENQNKE